MLVLSDAARQALFGAGNLTVATIFNRECSWVVKWKNGAGKWMQRRTRVGFAPVTWRSRGVPETRLPAAGEALEPRKSTSSGHHVHFHAARQGETSGGVEGEPVRASRGVRATCLPVEDEVLTHAQPNTSPRARADLPTT